MFNMDPNSKAGTIRRLLEQGLCAGDIVSRLGGNITTNRGYVWAVARKARLPTNRPIPTGSKRELFMMQLYKSGVREPEMCRILGVVPCVLRKALEVALSEVKIVRVIDAA